MKKMLITRLDVKKESLVFTFSSGTRIRTEKLIKMLEAQRLRFHFLSENKLKVRIRKDSAIDALSEAKAILKEFERHILFTL